MRSHLQFLLFLFCIFAWKNTQRHTTTHPFNLSLSITCPPDNFPFHQRTSLFWNMKAVGVCVRIQLFRMFCFLVYRLCFSQVLVRTQMTHIARSFVTQAIWTIRMSSVFIYFPCIVLERNVFQFYVLVHVWCFFFGGKTVFKSWNF